MKNSKNNKILLICGGASENFHSVDVEPCKSKLELSSVAYDEESPFGCMKHVAVRQRPMPGGGEG